jgi:hypothetical protein
MYSYGIHSDLDQLSRMRKRATQAASQVFARLEIPDASGSLEPLA